MGSSQPIPHAFIIEALPPGGGPLGSQFSLNIYPGEMLKNASPSATGTPPPTPNWTPNRSGKDDKAVLVPLKDPQRFKVLWIRRQLINFKLKDFLGIFTPIKMLTIVVIQENVNKDELDQLLSLTRLEKLSFRCEESLNLPGIRLPSLTFLDLTMKTLEKGKIGLLRTEWLPKLKTLCLCSPNTIDEAIGQACLGNITGISYWPNPWSPFPPDTTVEVRLYVPRPTECTWLPRQNPNKTANEFLYNIDAFPFSEHDDIYSRFYESDEHINEVVELGPANANSSWSLRRT